MALKKKKSKQADAPDTAAAAADEPAAPKAKSNVVPAALLAVGLLGGGFFMKGGGTPVTPAAAAEVVADGAGEEAAESEEHDEEEGPTGPIVEIEPITLNLADGRFLKVGLALHLYEEKPAEGAKEEKGEGEGKGKEPPPPLAAGETAKALDAAISLLSRYTMIELSDPAKRDEVKAQLTETLAELYDGKVGGVYWTDFVMQ